MRDPKVEQVLNSTPGIEWEYVPTLPLSKVNTRKSHQNQARIDAPLHTEWVRRYKEDKLSGDQFPAPVFFLDSGEYVVSDGNHRIQADTELGYATTDGYVVVADNPTTRAALTFEWNTFNLHGTTDEDADRHVIYLINQGETMKSVASQLHLSPRRVEEVVAEDAGHTRAIRMGVKSPWAKIGSRSARVRLHRDITMDEPFAVAVKLVAQFGLNGARTKDFTAEVAALPSEAAQLAFISVKQRQLLKEKQDAAAAAAAGKKRRGGKGRAPSELFKMHLAYINKAVTGNTVHGASFAELIGTPLDDDGINAMLSEIEQTEKFLFDAARVLRKIQADRKP